MINHIKVCVECILLINVEISLYPNIAKSYKENDNVNIQ